jgi:hypothetical protein
MLIYIKFNMEEEKKGQNPEVVATAKVEDETITVKVLLKG